MKRTAPMADCAVGFIDTYFSRFRGLSFIGEGWTRDEDGYHWTTDECCARSRCRGPFERCTLARGARRSLKTAGRRRYRLS